MQNHGKVNIGGGKFLDQSEIDAIAMANIKPTLDEINATAEKQRARDEEIRLEKDEQRRQSQKEKDRNAENKALMKRMKSKLGLSWMIICINVFCSGRQEQRAHEET
jgi:hypothetical protein